MENETKLTAQPRNKCGECLYICKDDGEPYCIVKDFYTAVKETDDACVIFVLKT